LGLDNVLSDLETENYATRTFVVPASAVQAPHKRDRVWIIAKNVGDTKYNGSSSSEIKRSNEENAGGTPKGKETTEQFKRASGRENHEYVSNSDNKRFRSCIRGNDFDISQESGGRGTDRTRGECHDEWSDSPTTKDEEMDVSNSNGKRSQRLGQEYQLRKSEEEISPSRNSWWATEPNVGRVAYGISSRVDRLKGLGNAIVPQIAMQIGKAIKEIYYEKKE
jgi:DNA (cytosine-5)-methyltransferase 1